MAGRGSELLQMRTLALLLAALAIAVPPGALARLLSGSTGPDIDPVVAGAWLWKGLLLFHATLLWIWARTRDAAPESSATASFAARGSAERATSERNASDPSSEGEARLRSTWVWLGALLAAALVLRLARLEDGLWFDEIKTLVRYVSLPLGQIVTTFDDQNQHILYSILARVSTELIGVTRSALRLPAVLLGVASVWAVYRFGREVTGRGEALLASALLTFSYHHVWFSQNARGYTGLLLWSLLASALFLELLGNDRPRRFSLALAYGATVALATYTHMTAVVVFGAHLLIAAWVLWRPRGIIGGSGTVTVPGVPAPRPIVWGLVLGVTLSAQLYAFVLPQVVGTLLTPSTGGLSIEWKDPLWLIRETLAGLSRGLPGGWVALLGGGAIAAVGVASYWKEHPRAVWLMILPAAITAMVILALGHNLWPRFFFFSAGFGALIVMRGLVAATRLVVRRRAAAVGFGVAALVVLGSATTVPAAWGDKQDYVGAAGFVDAHRSTSDAVVMLDMCILPYQEYWGRDWLIVSDARELEQVEITHARTWLVYSFPASLQTLQPDIWDRMQARYTLAASFPGTVNGGDIVVMVSE